MTKYVALLFPMLAISLLLTTPTYALETASTTHTIKLNIYDSTSLTTMIETCDSIKADQLKNNTYTKETYDELMKACEEAISTLDCLEDALDASECGDLEEEKEAIEEAIQNLVPRNTSGGRDPRILPPNTDTDSVWQITVLGKTYIVTPLYFIISTIVALIAICLAVFLVRRHIKNKGLNVKGVGNIKVARPLSKSSYELTYVKNLIKKHENDPLTEILDVSNIVRKYRIKYVLWHTVPILAIIVSFIALLLITTPTMADSEYASINLITTDGMTTTIINIDKATSGSTVTRGTNITAINTDIHSGGTIDEEGGVFAKYSPQLVGSQTIGDISVLLSNTAFITEQTTPGGTTLPNKQLTQSDVTNPFGPLLIPSMFDSTDLGGENTFGHSLALNLVDIQSIPSGTYHVGLEYTITVEEYVPPQEFTFTIDTTLNYEWNDWGDHDPTRFIVPLGLKNYDDEGEYNWLVYVDKYEYDNDNLSMDLAYKNESVVGINAVGIITHDDWLCDEWWYDEEECTSNLVISGLEPGIHTITIAPDGQSNYGWAGLFGGTGDAQKIVYLNTSMPVRGFMNSSVDASYAFSDTFSGAENLINAMSMDISYIDMSNIKDFSYMFSGTHEDNYSLANSIDISNLDISNAINIEGIFQSTHAYNTSMINTIDISGLNTSKIKDFSYMFDGTHCGNENLMATIDLSNLDTGNGANFTGMFQNTYSGNTNLVNPMDISNLDTGKGVNFSYMFSRTHLGNASLETTINISNLDTSGGTDFSHMFDGTHSSNTSLTLPIDLSNLDTSSGTDFSYMFSDVHGDNPNMTASIDITGLDTREGLNFSGMFLSAHSMGACGTNNITEPIDLSNLNTSKGTNFSWMFGSTHSSLNCGSYDYGITTPIDVSGLDTSNGTDFRGMFYGTHKGYMSLTDPINVSDLDVSKGIYFDSMFASTHEMNDSLTAPLDVSNFDVSNGVSFSNMFSHTFNGSISVATPIDVSNFDVSNGTNFSGMFSYTHAGNIFGHALTSPIDVSNFDVSNGISFSRMFEGTHYQNKSLLTPIDVSNFDVSNGTNFVGMFSNTHYNNTSLTSAALGNMRFHDSFKEKYSLWNKMSDSSSNTFYYAFSLSTSGGGMGAEPKFNDDTVLSSAGPIGLTSKSMPYNGRGGIIPAPLNTGWR